MTNQLQTSTALLAFILSLTLLCACSPLTQHEPALDEAGIYAAVIRQLYEVDDTFGGTLRPPIVYLVSRTDDSVGDPETDRAEPAVLADSLQSEIMALLDDLPTEFIWVAQRLEVPLDPDTDQVSGGGVIVTLGNIHLQRDGAVQVSGSIYIANLAAGGQTYVLKSIDGRWEVVGTTGVQWISQTLWQDEHSFRYTRS